MGSTNHKGQIMIEMLICAFVLLAVFFVGFELTVAVVHEQSKHRFVNRPAPFTNRHGSLNR